ncbi:MAG: aldehyde dehydrogenase family protein [Candidatus Nitrosopolaris sp.]
MQTILSMGLEQAYGLKTLIKRRNCQSRLVRTGMVTVNNVVFSDPRVPFGGVKHSGFGRELSRGGYMTGEREGYMAFLSGVQFVDHDSKNYAMII